MTIETLSLEKNGDYPNSRLPVVLYREVIAGGEISSSYFRSLFRSNGWDNSWKNGIYDFHHYHSTSHEVLGVYKGWAEVMLGGPGGKIVRLEKGDVAVIPAGVSHKCQASGEDFGCVGAYPEGMDYDMNYGKKEELKQGLANIQNVPVPRTDPVTGAGGKLPEIWAG